MYTCTHVHIHVYMCELHTLIALIHIKLGNYIIINDIHGWLEGHNSTKRITSGHNNDSNYLSMSRRPSTAATSGPCCFCYSNFRTMLFLLQQLPDHAVSTTATSGQCCFYYSDSRTMLFLLRQLLDHAVSTSATSGPCCFYYGNFRTMLFLLRQLLDHAVSTSATPGPCCFYFGNFRTMLFLLRQLLDHAVSTSATSGPCCFYFSNFRTMLFLVTVLVPATSRHAIALLISEKENRLLIQFITLLKDNPFFSAMSDANHLIIASFILSSFS